MNNLMIQHINCVTFLNKDIYSVLNATIERGFLERGIGYLTVSFVTVEPTNNIQKNFVTLIVDSNTIIQDPFGESVSFKDLRLGMRVNADFSSAMTKSIPPQARAFRIIVSYKNWPFNASLDRVLKVDIENRFLYTGDAEDINTQVRYVVNSSTIILDSRGNRIRMQDLNPGQIIRVEFATFMTFSIPPQTTAFSIQIIQN